MLKYSRKQQRSSPVTNKNFNMQAPLQFLIFILLLLAVTTQNGQTHPVDKKHTATHVPKRHSAVPAHKTHATTPANKRHATVSVHKLHSDVPVNRRHPAAHAHKTHAAVAAHKRLSTAHADRRHAAVPLHKKHAITAALKRHSYRTMQPSRIMPDSLRRALINSENNRLTNPGQLARLKEKLQRDVLSRKKVVRIVHIGDSHVQADMMTRVLRLGLQYRYGNAGRELSFPCS